MRQQAPTLKPGCAPDEPYGWLRGDDDYKLPQAWLETLPARDIPAVRILASYDEAGFARGGSFMG